VGLVPFCLDVALLGCRCRSRIGRLGSGLGLHARGREARPLLRTWRCIACNEHVSNVNDSLA